MMGIFNAETLLYIFMAVSVCMILFNVGYLGARRGRSAALEREARREAKQIAQAVAALEEPEDAAGRALNRHADYLKKSLAGTLNLMAFNAAMERVPITPARGVYVNALGGVFAALTGAYRRRNPTVQAYFAYTLSLYGISVKGTALGEKIKNDVASPSMYLRENSFNALCRMGDAPALADALAYMSRMRVFHMHKLITDALLTFTGSHDELCAKLFDKYGELTDGYRLALINYIGYKSGAYRERFFALLDQEEANKEIRIALLRYFRKHPFDKAESALLSALSDDDPGVWELAAVAANALGVYDTERSRAALCAALTRSNWYIRQNAADSLLTLKISQADIDAITATGDRYAIETLRYKLGERAPELAPALAPPEAAPVPLPEPVRLHAAPVPIEQEPIRQLAALMPPPAPVFAELDAPPAVSERKWTIEDLESFVRKLEELDAPYTPPYAVGVAELRGIGESYA